jgi:hypothetical protein
MYTQFEWENLFKSVTWETWKKYTSSFKTGLRKTKPRRREVDVACVIHGCVEFSVLVVLYISEIPKLWRPAPRGALFVFEGGCFCMRDIFILNEIWTQVKYTFWKALCLVEKFPYRLVPVLTSNWKQHNLLPAKVSFLSFFFVATRQLIQIKWHCCSSLYYFRIIMSTKGIIALWYSYSLTGPVLHTISLPAFWEVQGRNFKSGPQWTFNPGMMLALSYDLKFTKVSINLEMCVIH